MLTFSEAQLMAWLTPVLWPFLRVLGVFTTAPIFSARDIFSSVSLMFSGGPDEPTPNLKLAE